jgi:alpha-tubulin suppressor-like RCC1 family protein
VAGNGQVDTVGQLLPDSLTVKVTAVNGSGVKGVTVAFSVTSGGGTLSASSGLTDSLGRVSAGWTLGTTAGAATNRATASVQGLRGSPVEFQATAVPDRPSQLILVAGSGQTGVVGAALSQPIEAAAQDQYGNGTEGVVVGWVVAAGGGTVSASADTTDATGHSAVTWTIGTVSGLGRDTATATAAGLSGSPLMFVASANPGPPADLTIVSGNGQSAPVATELPDSFVVRVSDQFSNPVMGVAVAWAVTKGYGSISPALSTSDGSGLASAKLTLGTVAGTDSARAAVSMLPAAPFGAVANPGPPERVLARQGGGQADWPSDTLDDSLVAQLVDRYGNGIPGALIEWMVIAGGGTVSPASSETGDSGFASTQFRLGPDLGGNWATATFNGFPPVTFYDTAAVTYAQVDAGMHHTCGVAADSTVYCWGLNDRGQLGNDTGFIGTSPCSSACSLTPTRVSGGRKFVTVRAGGHHTCALSAEGEAYCWGDNGYGQALGDGSSAVLYTSLPVGVAGGHTFSTLSAGANHTCGIATDGNAYCWGWNQDGQLGDSSTATLRLVVRVAGGISFSDIGAGERHTCGVAIGGAAYCWGWNIDGQLGTGTTNADSAPAPIGGILFLSVTAGERHSCGVSLSGTAYCWGPNSAGQLGSGDTTGALTPQQVQGTQTFAAVSAGLQPLTCGLATNGSAYCWGSNNQGQTGSGGPLAEPYFASAPTLVVGGHTFMLVSAGGQHACALGSDGIAWCWGAGYLGQLGEGTISGWTSPRRVAFQR